MIKKLVVVWLLVISLSGCSLTINSPGAAKIETVGYTKYDCSNNR